MAPDPVGPRASEREGDAATPTTRRCALLLTDLVDSTALSERLGDVGASTLFAAHDRVARDLLRVHGGREIDRTDGFLLLFDRPDQALAYASAYHRAILSLEPPLRARAGLHHGEVTLRANPAEDVHRGAKPLEVDGLAKPLAARVMALAGAGRTLLTAAARDEIGRAADGWVSHGHWRLKGVSEPIELFEARDQDAAGAPPADAPKAYRVVRRDGVWLPVRQVDRSLPAERDRFVGRERDLAELAGLLDEGARLVTVVGVGGTGKTRLVTRFAWSWLGDYPGGAWFCDLSEARDADGIVGAVANGFRVPLGRDEPVAQLGHVIAARGECLIVLDNAEQVARFTADAVSAWLDRAPQARFLVTSREILGLPGELTFVLAPLEVDDAVHLFVERARGAGARPDAALSPVAALVRQLDGLPLAIELAAARARVMSADAMLERLHDRFRLLAAPGGRRERHATLRATLDWSWELLSHDERVALADLSLFEGGFTLEAAEAVLTLTDAWAVDVVQALVDKSLLRPSGANRIDLLVTVQEYARHRLHERGDADAREVEARHGAWAAGLGNPQVLNALNERGGRERVGELGRELPNLVAAVRRAVRRRDGQIAVDAIRAAWAVLRIQGPFRVGVELAAEVRAIPGLDEAASGLGPIAANALTHVGRHAEARTLLEATLAHHRGQGDRRGELVVLAQLGPVAAFEGRMSDARELQEQALGLAVDLGDRREEALALRALGDLDHVEGRIDEAWRRLSQALDMFRQLGDRRSEALAVGGLGLLAWQRGQLDEARPLLEEALAIHREQGELRTEAEVLNHLGAVDASAGRDADARGRYQAALAIHREVGNRIAEGIVLTNLGIALAVQGNYDDARAHHEASLAIHRETRNRRHEANVLVNLAEVLVLQGRVDEARVAYETALEVHRSMGNRRVEGYATARLGLLHARSGDLTLGSALLVRGEELLREVGDTIEVAKVLAARAEVRVLAGDPSGAEQLLAEAARTMPAGSARAAAEIARVRALLPNLARLDGDG